MPSRIEMLAISSVQLPPQWMEKRDDVTFFAVDVIAESGACWRVMRRYTDFLELKDQLGRVSASFPAARFPKKHCFSCEGHKLEARREALELWLRRAIEHPRSSAEWLAPLRRFMESGRKFVTITETSAPPMVEQERPADEVLLEVVLPPGIVAGRDMCIHWSSTSSASFELKGLTNRPKQPVSGFKSYAESRLFGLWRLGLGQAN